MKKIFLKPRFKGMHLHALYDELIRNPPNGYTFIKTHNAQSGILTNAVSKHRNYLYKQLMYHFGSMPYSIMQHLEPKFSENADLIYASQHVINSEKPWVVDLEYSNALSAYCSMNFSKQMILKKLSSPYCKAILPWSEWAAITLKNSLNCSGIMQKINVVRYSVTPKKNFHIKKDNNLQILFLGSMNPANVLSFEFKGLYETIDAFLEIEKKYDNVQLVVRSAVPSKIKDKVKKSSKIRILDKPIPKEELEHIFMSSDIFPHTGFEVLNLSVLEAMSYGLPVIATSLYSTPEAIMHQKNGLLVNLPDSSTFYTKNKTPKDYSNSFLLSMRRLRPFMKEKLKEYLKLLIEDDSLRHKLGENAKKTIEHGEFSIKKRNSILKEVFDNAIR